MTAPIARFTYAEPLDHFQCRKCKRHCYGNWTQHFVQIVGDGVPYNKHGPYCDDCFPGVEVSVTVRCKNTSCMSLAGE